MCIRDSLDLALAEGLGEGFGVEALGGGDLGQSLVAGDDHPVSYTNLRAHETVLDIVCRLLLANKKKQKKKKLHTRSILLLYTQR